MENKEKDIKKRFSEVNNKHLVIDEKIDFTKQKISKSNLEIGELKLKLLMMEKKSNEIY